MFPRASVVAGLLLSIFALQAFAYTVADPGFAVSDYATVAGAKGIAFDTGGTLHTNTDGGLAYVGTQLYAVSRTANEVREIDGTGATVRVISTNATLGCPDGLAGFGSDLYVTSCAGIYRIRAVNGPLPLIQLFSNPGSSFQPTHAITVSPDGAIFATSDHNHVWLVGTVADSFAAGTILTDVSHANGVAVLSPPNRLLVPTWRFVFVAGSDGSVYVYDQRGEITQHAIVTGGTGGDHSVIGPDGCLYVPQAAAIGRIARAGGGCDLAGALAATPTIRLSGGLGIFHINAAPAGFNAALANVPTGASVTFTVTGKNPQSTSVLPTGNNAAFS